MTQKAIFYLIFIFTFGASIFYVAAADSIIDKSMIEFVGYGGILCFLWYLLCQMRKSIDFGQNE